ncbi:NTP transferase domain-containing protein [Candidatus Woesearchaeota archaeon]|nr:NTP transferase domain-containing protein [Candidatus Woesearchaeota archaeon]
MQAVILAAGKSTRTYPLTLTRPKPLLKVANKTLLEHNLDAVKNDVSEVIVVVGYKKDQIKKYFGKKYGKIKIKYVEQKKQLGTAHALLTAKKYIKGKFLLMMGDDIYSKEDVKKCMEYDYSILAVKVKDPRNFGVIIEKKGVMRDFIEKPSVPISNLASTAFYCLDKKIFDYLKNLKESKRKELELPDAIRLLSEDEPVHVVKTKNWMPIVYVWDLLKADNIIRKRKNFIGKSRIFGTVKNSSVGDNCTIFGTVKNSIIMDNSLVMEGSLVENSIIGENVIFDGQARSKKNVYPEIKGKKIKVSNFGTVISDKVIAESVIIKPGIRISPGKKLKGKIMRNV